MRMLSAVLVLGMSATSARAEDTAAPAETTAEVPTEPGRPEEKGALGVGLIFGEPTGIAVKLYLADDRAIQGAVGASFAVDAYQLHAEYVFHPWILQDRDTFVLPVYLGPGVRAIQYAGRGGDDHFALGLRAVAGMLFDFKNVPLDVFLEVAGIVEYDFTDGAGLGLNVGAGARYYF
jgi:hypothetical protein